MVEPPAHNRAVPGSSPGGPIVSGGRYPSEGNGELMDYQMEGISPPAIMRGQLKLLFELNQLDIKVAALRGAFEKVPVRREELETLLGQRKVGLQGKTARLAEMEKSKRDKEGEVQLSESRIAEFKTKLSQIKTNKEYQSALKEIEETKKSNKLLEDQTLQLMTDAETVKKEVTDDETALKLSLENYEKESNELRSEEARLKEAIAQVEQERARLVGAVDPKILDKYYRVKKIRAEAVTFVEGATCMGCHMHIPPQLFIEIKKFQAVHTCPSCHRILYLQETKTESTKENRAS